MYQKSEDTCAICHEECDGPCTGEGPGQCVRCKHVRDGPYCVAQCPATKYNSSGECLPCHENCVGGCSGPANTVGEGGCFSCEGAIVGSSEEVVSTEREVVGWRGGSRLWKQGLGQEGDTPDMEVEYLVFGSNTATR